MHPELVVDFYRCLKVVSCVPKAFHLEHSLTSSPKQSLIFRFSVKIVPVTHRSPCSFLTRGPATIFGIGFLGTENTPGPAGERTHVNVSPPNFSF